MHSKYNSNDIFMIVYCCSQTVLYAPWLLQSCAWSMRETYIGSIHSPLQTSENKLETTEKSMSTGFTFCPVFRVSHNLSNNALNRSSKAGSATLLDGTRVSEVVLAIYLALPVGLRYFDGSGWTCSRTRQVGNDIRRELVTSFCIHGLILAIWSA